MYTLRSFINCFLLLTDICEDPELRERIMELRTEQETKREAARRRVKRTQSNNTRTQSVRRTSIRDKTLTSKKDAVEEARLRRQAQEVVAILFLICHKYFRIFSSILLG